MLRELMYVQRKQQGTEITTLFQSLFSCKELYASLGTLYTRVRFRIIRPKKFKNLWIMV